MSVISARRGDEEQNTGYSFIYIGELSLILHLTIKGLGALAAQLRKYLDIGWTYEVAAVATLSLTTQAQIHKMVIEYLKGYVYAS